jgi:hypothetical protein
LFCTACPDPIREFNGIWSRTRINVPVNVPVGLTIHKLRMFLLSLCDAMQLRLAPAH